jgi:hypothetical protein
MAGKSMADAICAFCKVANAVKVAMAIFCASLEDSLLLLLLDCLRRIEEDDDVSRRRRRDSKVERHHVPTRVVTTAFPKMPRHATSRENARESEHAKASRRKRGSTVLKKRTIDAFLRRIHPHHLPNSSQIDKKRDETTNLLRTFITVARFATLERAFEFALTDGRATPASTFLLAAN